MSLSRDPGSVLAHRYHPFYCEENIWWLCAEPALGAELDQVIFVASTSGACPVAEQRAGGPDGVAWWDYHCIGLDAGSCIWDLDSRLPLPVPAKDWLRRSFPAAAELPEPLQPRFRLVSAARYRAEFASDRRHMRTADGGWLHAPPPWPCIGSGWNLDRYRDVRDPAGPGRLFDLEDLAALV